MTTTSSQQTSHDARRTRVLSSGHGCVSPAACCAWISRCACSQGSGPALLPLLLSLLSLLRLPAAGCSNPSLGRCRRHCRRGCWGAPAGWEHGLCEPTIRMCQPAGTGTLPQGLTEPAGVRPPRRCRRCSDRHSHRECCDLTRPSNKLQALWAVLSGREQRHLRLHACACGLQGRP